MGLRIYLYLGLLAVAGFVILTVLGRFNMAVNSFLGMAVGIYPFMTWHIAGRLLFTNAKSGYFKPAIIGFILIKLLVIGLILYLIVSANFFTIIPFIIGLLIAPPVMLINTLVTDSRTADNKF
ncbi:MAG: hypothetical protein HY762_05920 [Planctomycetes bacterium]|nr:hypothetical protein [Planctomycetota bacterium]